VGENVRPWEVNPLLVGVAILTIHLSLLFVSVAQGEIKTALKSGPQLDHLEWTIGSDPSFILSELIFDSMSIHTEGSITWYDPVHPWLLEGRAGFGQVLSGSVIDTDYLSPGRANLFSESESDLDGHNNLNFEIDLGYRTGLTDRFLSYWLVGFAWSQTRYQIVNGLQTKDPFNLTVLGPFSGLNSEYRAKWYGPTMGFNVITSLHPWPFLLQFDARYWPYLWYEGKGVWNLRSDFMQDPSFIHEATGYGGDVQVRLRHFLSKSCSVELGYSGMYLRASEGTDTTFFSNGTVSTIPLLNVSQNSHFFHVGLEFIWGDG